MRWIIDKLVWCIELAYGEITVPLTGEKKVWKILTICFFLAVLGIAIAGTISGRLYGILAWILTAIYLVWNICLDEYSGFLFQLIHRKVHSIEKEGEAMPDGSIKRFLYSYIRLLLPMILTILVLISSGIILIF